MCKHSIHSPSNLETVVQLAKQCWKEERDFLEERLPSHRQGWRLEGATSNVEDYTLPGRWGLPSAPKRDNGIQPGANGCDLVDCDGLPPLCHCRHGCISSHVTRVGPTSPRFGPKECDESGMHTHLLFVAFQVTSISPYFLAGNAVGAALQIIRLYNSGVELLKNEEDWPHVGSAFTCDLWKSTTNKEYFTCMAHWVRDKVGGGLEFKQRVVTTCEVLVETMSITGEWWTAWYMFCYTFVVWKSSATPHARSEAIKMALLKLTAIRWKQCLPHASSWGNNCIICSFYAVLLGRLHGVCFCAMTLMRTLTLQRQC